MKDLVELAKSFNLQGTTINRNYEVRRDHAPQYGLCDEPGTNCDCTDCPSDCDCTSDDCDNDCTSDDYHKY